jgi:hypothetical protein
MVTKEQAIRAAAACLAEGYILLDTLPVEEAARLAHQPYRKDALTLAELEARIRARREARPA